MEITEQLNRFKLIFKVFKIVTQSFFFVVRKTIKLYPIKDGNIVVISLLKLGDSVFTIPAIREIQNFYKKKIVMVCFPESIPIFDLALTGVSFSPIDHKNFLFNERIANWKARKVLKASNPEIIFDLNGVMTSATLIFTSRARMIAGMAREQFKTIYDIYVPPIRNDHLMDMYLNAITPLIPIKDREKIKRFPRTYNQSRKILIHPFAGWMAKEWDLRKFIELGRLLKHEYQVSIIAPIKSIRKDVITEIEEIGMTFIETKSVEALIIYIEECAVFIGNDSGPIHIADLLGKATFSIYGPTNPEFPIPIGSHHSYCKSVIKCTPKHSEEFCFTNGGRNGCPTFECMNSLTVERVYSELSQFLEKILKT